MLSFSLLIKPASASCNLRCGYCFYREKLAMSDARGGHRMSEATLKTLIEKFMGLGFAQNHFSWQGGEPLLMGLPFYRKAVEFQAKQGRAGQRVGNSVQTNGLLLDDAWCAFFNEYRFLIGLSLDGPQEIHDAWRKGKSGESVFDRVLKAVRTLQRNRTEFNVLTVISRANVQRGREVYRFLKDLGVRHHQYIPAILTAGKSGPDSDYGITGEAYGRFLLDLFEEWRPSDTRTVSVRFFDAIVNTLVTGQSGYCETGGSCDSYLVLEHNGDVYPCDFFVEKGWRLGNINRHSFDALSNHPKRAEFASLKTDCAPECGGCEFFALCRGGCTRHRDFIEASPRNRSALCEGIKMFLTETLPEFKSLAAVVRSG